MNNQLTEEAKNKVYAERRKAMFLDKASTSANDPISKLNSMMPSLTALSPDSSTIAAGSNNLSKLRLPAIVPQQVLSSTLTNSFTNNLETIASPYSNVVPPSSLFYPPSVLGLESSAAQVVEKGMKNAGEQVAEDATKITAKVVEESAQNTAEKAGKQILENAAEGKYGKVGMIGAGVAGALATAGLISALSSTRGQQSNAQLYGQRPLY